MQISLFRGSRTVMSLRLCSRAPWITSSSAAISDAVYRGGIGQTGFRFSPAKGGTKAGPRPLLGPGAQSGADGVEDDVVEDGGEVLVGVHRLRPEAIAEQMAAALVPAVEAKRVGSVEAVHPAREVFHRRGGSAWSS